MSLNDDIKLSNIELVNENVNILHSSETGSLKIDSENGSIKFGHTGINLFFLGFQSSQFKKFNLTKKLWRVLSII